MARLNKIGKGHTRVKVGDDGVTRVTLYDTVVVEFTEHAVILNAGEFKTVTTKNRMNQASNQFNLGYRVYQVKGVWWVSSRVIPAKFYNGMVIPR